MKCLGAFVLLLLHALPALSLSATVTRVSDGDTLWVRVHDSGASAAPRRLQKIRLQGIDAPERCQAWGAQAKSALEARVLHRRVRLQRHATDDYRRGVATLQVDGEDVGAWMVGQGHAWSAGPGGGAGPYAAQQRLAQLARRGLFADRDPVEPRVFRRRHGPCP
jgi:micrococcal nuclease